MPSNPYKLNLEKGGNVYYNPSSLNTSDVDRLNNLVTLKELYLQRIQLII